MTEKPSYAELEQTVAQLRQDLDLLKKNDLTERHHKALAIMDHLEEGVYEIDMKGSFTFVNPAVCDMTGYDEDELLGMNHTRLMNKKNAEAMVRTYSRVVKTDLAVDSAEFELTRNDGLIRTVVSSITLMRDEDQKPLGFRGTLRDISEKKILEEELIAKQQESLVLRDSTIMGLAKLAEYRDKDVGSHLDRIREYSRVLAKDLANQKKYKTLITDQYITDIYLASILHDIGKVSIPDAVLLKPGKLTMEEFDIIKEHSRMGAEALKSIGLKFQGETFVSMAGDIAMYHHERWNGKGYPEGLQGDAIPLAARIVSLVDVYDALTCKLVYKEAFSHEQAIKIIVKERGQQFDPDVVDAFMTCNKEFIGIQRHLDDSSQDSKMSPPMESFV